MRLTNAEITEKARGIVTGDLLIADLSDMNWQISLALFMEHLREINKGDWIGTILVPVGPHIGTRWLNGRVPGCTFKCELIHINDTARLAAECDRMSAALYPETVGAS
jgi:hypothetical protein